MNRYYIQDMETQVRQLGTDGQDRIFKRDAVKLAQAMNANIGILAYGKALYFYKVMLEKMEKEVGKTIDLGYLVDLCGENGKDIGLCKTRCFVTLNEVEISEEEWFKNIEEMGNH